MESLFGHLATKFGSGPEPLATESLFYVLQRSTEARRLLGTYIRTACPNLPEGLNLRAPVAEEGGTADLVAVDGGGVARLVIQASFWAGLSAKMPVSQLDKLPEGGVVLYIAPLKRFGSFWAELVRRCRDGGREMTGEKTAGNNWIVANLPQNRTVALTSWQAILEPVIVGLQQAGDQTAAADLLQLRGLADKLDSEAFLPFTSEELTGTLGRRIVHFCELVDAVATKLETEGSVDAKGQRPSGGPNGSYVRTFKMNGAGCRFVFNPSLWATQGCPLWLQLLGEDYKPSPDLNRRVTKFATRVQTLPFVNEWGAFFPLTLSAGVEKEPLIEKVCVAIRQIGALLHEGSPAAITIS